jgi:hypothetical protein
MGVLITKEDLVVHKVVVKECLIHWILTGSMFIEDLVLWDQVVRNLVSYIKLDLVFMHPKVHPMLLARLIENVLVGLL